MTHRIAASARSAAPPSAVFALLADGASWPRWGDWAHWELREPAPGGGEGAGSVKALTSTAFGRTTVSVERVAEVVPDRLLRYELVSGLPLLGYVGSVELTPDGTGTTIRWSAVFERSRPRGTAWLYRLVLRAFLARTATRLARAAEQTAPPSR